MAARSVGNDVGKACFACARRTPENATAQFVGADCTTKQAAVVDYVALPDKLTKHDGAHAFRQGDVCFLVLLKY